MPNFTCVYYETIRIEHEVNARTASTARRKSRVETSRDGWAGCDEETLGTEGVAEVLDEAGKRVWPPERKTQAGTCITCGQAFLPGEDIDEFEGQPYHLETDRCVEAARRSALECDADGNLTPEQSALIAQYLKGQFAWLGTDDCPSGSDVIDHLGSVYEVLTERSKHEQTTTAIRSQRRSSRERAGGMGSASDLPG